MTDTKKRSRAGLCHVRECRRAHYARNLCQAHYRKLKRGTLGDVKLYDPRKDDGFDWEYHAAWFRTSMREFEHRGRN